MSCIIHEPNRAKPSPTELSQSREPSFRSPTIIISYLMCTFKVNSKKIETLNFLWNSFRRNECNFSVKSSRSAREVIENATRRAETSHKNKFYESLVSHS